MRVYQHQRYVPAAFCPPTPEFIARQFEEVKVDALDEGIDPALFVRKSDRKMPAVEGLWLVWEARVPDESDEPQEGIES